MFSPTFILSTICKDWFERLDHFKSLVVRSLLLFADFTWAVAQLGTMGLYVFFIVFFYASNRSVSFVIFQLDSRFRRWSDAICGSLLIAFFFNRLLIEEVLNLFEFFWIWIEWLSANRQMILMVILYKGLGRQIGKCIYVLLDLYIVNIYFSWKK